MSKTKTLSARIDCDLKENAENILAQLGLTPTDAIKLFYKQIELCDGLPFEIKIPSRLIAENRLLSELKIGEQSAESGNWLSIEDSRKALGI